MKYIFLFLFFGQISFCSNAQAGLPLSFFEGKSVVMISTDPASRPAMSWQVLADSLHYFLVKAGADPVAYFELEQVALSESTQEDYANAFLQRQVSTVILLTRQKDRFSIQVSPFSWDGKIISSNMFYVTGNDWKEAGSQLVEVAKSTKSKNLLVNDVPEFPTISSQKTTQSIQKFLPRNPLNLDVFKLGIPLQGSSAETSTIGYFRYDLFVKSEATILAEQTSQKADMQSIFERIYPNDIQWLTESYTSQQLIADQVQFVLMKVEGRQYDLMKSMGLQPLEGEEGLKTVVKYYIKFLVRDELYIGPSWDANPDWKLALTQFLENLKN